MTSRIACAAGASPVPRGPAPRGRPGAQHHGWLVAARGSRVSHRVAFLALGVLLGACPDTGGDDDATSAMPTTATPTAEGHLTVSPDAVSFPSTTAGEHATETVVLTNSGSDPLTLYAIYFPDDGGGAFGFGPDQSDPSGTVLQGEDTLAVVVDFAPSGPGEFRGTLRIASGDPDTPNLDVPLTGQGIEAPSPDNDGDGYSEDDGDCDDQDPGVYPDAQEVCDDADNDCDGQIDEDAIDAFAVYPDQDHDGYGASEEADESCVVPPGYTTVPGDCDDTSDAIAPGAQEMCDGVDNDCDTTIDEDAVDAVTVYPDGDGDGFGATSGTLQACAPPDGYVAATGDCDDTDPDVNPDAVEVCDGLDNDCDGVVDNAGETLFYTDGDGDGHGDPATGVAGCGSVQGQVAQGDDCDDSDPAVYPGADELCNNLDDDCDSQVDESPADGTLYYADADGDGFGAGDPVPACAPGSGLVEPGGDCDDTNPTIHPGADEPCDGVDNDCDGETDEGGQTTLYADADGDGWGDDNDTIFSCQSDGYVGTGGDCNDLNPTIHPMAEEVCDNIDQDCDGLVDEGVTTTYYLDRDGDGYGDDATPSEACAPPSSVFLSQGGDCNDMDPAVNPGAAETCNAVDDDCDGKVDEDSADSETYYLDADGDGYGDPDQSLHYCKQPEGYVSGASDCDDTDPDIHPGMAEVCDEIDQDCNGVVDDNPTDADTWYPDVDQDGYGSIAGGVASCTQPPGYLPSSGDCNDSVSSIHPDATEVCDGVDQDCDGIIDEDLAWAWYIDRDGDGYGDASTEVAACRAPSDFYVDQAGDCDDFDPDTYPEANEFCNGKDDDCDGTVDEPDAADAGVWYQDQDMDGHGNPDAPQVACYRPEAYVSVDDDCNDDDATVNPDATEWCNSVDDDCDGTVDEPDAADAPTWYLDVDSDGFGTALSSRTSCTQPSGYVAESTDCNDSDPEVNPDAIEYCNGKDDDCDGVTDGADAVDGATWYQDADSDGFGHPDRTQVTCDQPAGYVDNNLDCDDLDPDTYPGAVEQPTDGRDNDCDGRIDENGPLAALPKGLTGHSTVYDPVRRRVLLFGGRSLYELEDAVYVLDLSGGNTGVWERLDPAPDAAFGTPAPRRGHVAVYDTARDQMVLFGGMGYYTLYRDVWSLSFTGSEQGTWTRIALSGDEPVPRAFSAAAFDPVDERIVVHGGRTYYQTLGDVWSLTLSASPAWSLLHGGDSGAPGPREKQAFTYDPVHDRFLMFGGDGRYTRNQDVWAFDPATRAWSQLVPGGETPPPLAGVAAVFHPEASEWLIFGGKGYYRISSALYALDLSDSEDGTWSRVDAASTFLPAAGAGAVVLDPDALYLMFLGEGYYRYFTTPQSSEW